MDEELDDLDALSDRDEYKGLHLKKRSFLNAYINSCGRIGKACEVVGMSRQVHYKWMRLDPDYKAAFEEARDNSADLLEEEAMRRAYEGTIKPIYQGGDKVGEVREFSDTLTIFLLKGMKPEKYRERANIEHTGAGGGPIVQRFEADLARIYGNNDNDAPAE